MTSIVSIVRQAREMGALVPIETHGEDPLFVVDGEAVRASTLFGYTVLTMGALNSAIEKQATETRLNLAKLALVVAALAAKGMALEQRVEALEARVELHEEVAAISYAEATSGPLEG